MESFVSSVIAAGFGANDEGVEREVLAKLLAERPVPPGALLCGGGDARRLAALGALSEGADYVADVIQRGTAASTSPGAAAPGAAAAGPGGGAASAAAGGAGGGATPRGDSWGTRLMTSLRGRGGGLERGLTESLAHLADRWGGGAGPGGCRGP